ncbi:Flavodoxin [Oscillibacter sp. PC13]|uniref:flavodoxin n=1 Tax=Oscillibacter sp. PC13 TaxID=1855299 RepID=UPI0008F0C219|nr:flavodoxin [Oscillibacter sp. PC13]SFP36748.1 Flavodoxin [Oscillibacter sp. PC13]
MNRTLVAYFSASGVTAKVAQNLAASIGADLFEIVPETPYTDADLDWNNPHSRSSVEMKDKSSRPAIVGGVESIGRYDTIFVGFPIWWYVAPTIISTFLEQYDLTGKTIIPFATSGSSGMGRTNADLEPSCKGALLKEGRRFSANVGTDELKRWAESIGELN